MGDARGAEEQFVQVTRGSPEFTRAHFSLGVLMEAERRHGEAIQQLSTALKYDAGYVEARGQLAGVFAKRGRPEDALVQYQQVLDREPAQRDAAFGYAMTLVRLQRYQEARDRIVDGMKAHPDQPLFSHALARLLAAAPDDRVRDGRRAIKLA